MEDSSEAELQSYNGQKISSGVKAFQSAAPELLKRAAWTLSVSVSITKGELAEAISDVWSPSTNGDSVENTVNELADWPFVSKGVDGMSMLRSRKRVFSEQFRTNCPDKFRTTHEKLSSIERRREEKDDYTQMDDWFIGGRIAYYLAGYDEQKSVEQFQDRFTTNLPVDRQTARVWLSSLVLEQDYLLEDFDRDLEFYRGFRLYSSGDVDHALNHFRNVIDSGTEDKLYAISLHLASNIIRPKAPSIDDLKESVRISKEIGFSENEVMARNTLSTALLQRSHSRVKGSAHDIERAYALARENTRRAIEIDFDDMVPMARSWQANMRWIWITDDRSEEKIKDIDEEEIERTVEGLRNSMEELLQYEKYYGYILTGNNLAQVFRDIGNYEDAISIVEEVLNEIEWLMYAPESIDRLGQTTGDLISITKNDDIYRRADKALSRIDKLKSD